MKASEQSFDTYIESPNSPTLCQDLSSSTRVTSEEGDWLGLLDTSNFSLINYLTDREEMWMHASWQGNIVLKSINILG